jgi:imidazolonepropionase-like amidohydrolase
MRIHRSFLITAAAVTASITSLHAQATSSDADLRRGTPNASWRSTYTVPASPPTLLRNATIMTAAGQELTGADLLMQDGRITAIGRSLSAPAGAVVIDAAGRFVTPGLIDSHSHIGVSPVPEVPGAANNNEEGMTTPQVWIEHSVWPQGPGFARALAGGATTLQLLPGSGDLIEGRGITVKSIAARTAQEMMFPGAPHTVKLACGENPRRGNGYPNTKMGNVAGYRAAFIAAAKYRAEWDTWLEARSGTAPDRDLGLETLAEVLRGNILVQWHCYTADEMATNLQIAKEFGFQVRSFHHAVEAYKIADLLAEAGRSASMWSQNWGFKMEAIDGISENVALVSAAGARAIIHSDDDMRTQYLNHEAAKSMWAARRAGLDVSRDEALRWVTVNPAWAMGVDDRVGTLEVGKNADVVLWSGDPLSVYSIADQVWIDGALRWDRTDIALQPISDFELGMHPLTAMTPANDTRIETPANGDNGSPVALPTMQSASVAIVGGTVHPVSGAAIENGVVVMRDGRISAVGPAQSVSIPGDARRIDATGKIVTPGFFDAGTQIGLVEVGSVASTQDGSLNQGANRAAFRASDGLNSRSMLIPVVRTEGVTNVITAPSGGVISGQSAALDLAGASRHDLLVRDPAAVHVTLGPSAAGSAGGSRGGVVLELRKALDAAQDAMDDEDEPGSDVAPLVAALREEIPVVVRASGAGDIEMALDLQAEYHFRMIIDGGDEAWIVAEALAARNVPVMIRALENRPTQFDRLGTRYDGPAILERAGVDVILTTRTSHSAGQLPHQAGNAVRYGMSWEAALRAVTLHPARAFGLDGAYGTLAEGSIANVVVWSDDPFEFSGYAEHVFIRGQELDRDSRQRRLFERYRTLDGDIGYRR